MRRRLQYGIIFLSVGLFVSIGWGYSQLLGRQQAEAALEARYQQRFYEALGHIENVELLVGKALASTSSEEKVRYLTEVWQQAMSSQDSLNALPLRQGTLMRTSRFLTQLGDYSYVVSKKVVDGGDVSQEHWEQLQQLQEGIASLSESLQQIANEAETMQPWDTQARRPFSLAGLFRRAPEVERIDSFSQMEQSMHQIPTLVYDGPFSDHITAREAPQLSGEPVDDLTARQIAYEFVPLTSADKESYYVEQAGETADDSRIAAWNMQIMQAGNVHPVYSLGVTKRGGHILWMLDNRAEDEQRSLAHSLEEAVQLAQTFVEARGFENFTVTYPVVENGRAIIPFVSVQDDVLMYPDQLKVTVSLRNGSIVGFDATQYYMSHRERELEQPELTEEEARERIPDDMDIIDVYLALIPQVDLSEVLTYEVRIQHGEQRYHIYINALTGKEEQVLNIIQSKEDGLLAV